MLSILAIFRSRVLVAFVCVTIFFGCSTPVNNDIVTNDKAILKAGNRQCLMSSYSDGGTQLTVRWCALHQMFQPTQHSVTIGNHVVYDGTDYSGVRFEKEVGARRFSGRCVAEMEITDFKTEKKADFDQIPQAVIQACGITRAGSGETTNFVMNRACLSALDRELPLVPGGLSATMDAQRCTVASGDLPVFTGRFFYR